MKDIDKGSFARDAIVGTLTAIVLFGLGIGILSYLFIVGFDMLEMAFGPVEHYNVVFAMYLIGIGVVSAAIAHILRKHADTTDIPKWRFGVASVFVILGGFALFFTVFISLGAGLMSVLITGTTALVLLGVAGWLTGLLDTPITTE
jgi:FtsH-binding integral membrane protein